MAAALFAAGFILPTQALLAQDITFRTQHYRCDGDTIVSATYFDTGLMRYAVLGFDGKQIALGSDMTARSDIRYESTDPQDSHVWWLNWDQAILLRGSGDDEELVYAECLPDR